MALALAGVAIAGILVPAEGQRMPAGPAIADETRSRSIGYTNRGRLLHSVELEPSDLIRIKNRNANYGTAELIALIEWAAREVERHHPGSSMLVGDISRRRGRRLRPHRSHRAGRDADIGFYLKDAEGAPARVPRFVRLGRSGKGRTRRDDAVYEFDDARNWAFVAALMGQDAVPVQYVMAIRPLKARLMEEGRRQGAPQWLLDRVEQAVGPRHTRGRRRRSYGTHNSHFHIRIYCTGEDRPRCRDKPPFWPWVNYPAPEDDSVSRRRRRRSRGRRRTRRRRGRRGSSMRR
jgi:penicillin-insensitive murein endopeptidase